MFTVTRWWLVRHAPVPGYEGRLYPHEDVDADVSNQAAFDRLAERLPKEAVWVTSGIRRAEQTAAAVRAAGLAPAAHIAEPAFAEQSFGDWAGQSYDQLMAQSGETGAGLREQFWTAPGEVRPPAGESFCDLIGRVSGAFGTLTEAHRGKDIVAVAHGGSIRAMLCHVLELHPNKGFGISIDNLSTTRVDHFARADGAESWRVAFVNLRPT
ncbi:MAG: histidine phosphatase family protein [Minwuiales bacterium]|nr:histidine phosphatase family protein [Minwuiales bacterium]